MTRDERLLPRLLASLDTLTNDAEIAEVVRQVRRIRGPAAFTGPMGDKVPLIDDREDVAMQLRRLGHVLRFGMPPNSQHAKAVAQIAAALTLGAQWAPAADVRATLAVLCQFLDQLRLAYEEFLRERMKQQASYGSAAQANQVDVNALHDAMRNVAEQIRR